MAKEKEAPKKNPGKSRRKLLLIGAPLLILLIAGGAAAAYFLGVFDSTATPQAEASETDVRKARELGPLVKMEEFVVNIMHKDETRFLKVGITLEAKDEISSGQVIKRMPQITDAVLLLLGNKRFDDIKDLQGKLQLKADLLACMNGLTGREEVVNLFFTDFVIQ